MQQRANIEMLPVIGPIVLDRSMHFIEETLRDFVRDAVKDIIGEVPTTHTIPEYIKIEDAARIAKCDRAVIDALIAEAPGNGFPAVRLGPKTIRIDKQRMIRWLSHGGVLNGVN